jgi:3-deoxy-D-arabino-heptulosonate 7-phosphate (DAHP) synthase
MDRERLELREALHQVSVERDQLTQRVRDQNQELKRLRLDIVQLQSQVNRYALHRRGRSDTEISALVEKELKRLLTVCHPDRWQAHPCATELTKHVNALRERFREGSR